MNRISPNRTQYDGYDSVGRNSEPDEFTIYPHSHTKRTIWMVSVAIMLTCLAFVVTAIVICPCK